VRSAKTIVTWSGPTFIFQVVTRLAFAHGLDRVMIAGLVLEDLATAQREITLSGLATIEVVRIRITDAERMALDG
jgi:hypothetical protein